MSITLGISIGMSSVLARAIGSGTDEPAHVIATGGMILAGIMMLIVSVIGIAFLNPLLVALGTNQETRLLASYYLLWWFASLFFMALPSVGANALRATGDAKVSSVIMVSGSVLQIALAPIFVFGWLGLPELGMPGASIGNFCARVLVCLATAYILVNHHQLIRIGQTKLRELVSIWRRILAVGLPATATNMIGPLSAGLITALLAQYGQETVAGFGIASRLEGLVVIPLFALSASIGPFVGQTGAPKLLIEPMRRCASPSNGRFCGERSSPFYFICYVTHYPSVRLDAHRCRGCCRLSDDFAHQLRRLGHHHDDLRCL